MSTLLQILRELFPKTWPYLMAAALVLSSSYSLWLWDQGKYQAEEYYHQWAGSTEAHWFDPDSVEYNAERGTIRVKWLRLPKVPDCGFTERYLKYRIGKEPIERLAKAHRGSETGPHRVGTYTDATNIKHYDAYGEEMFVGNPPIDIVVQYEYHEDCPRHLPKIWQADQRIVYLGD